MAISDGIYEGNDYLPHRYHSWMTEPYRVVILAKRDGKLAILSLQIEAEAFDAYLSTLRAKLEHETGTGSLEQESRLVVLEEEQLRHILLDPGVSSQIELPGDVIIQDWQPLKLVETKPHMVG